MNRCDRSPRNNFLPVLGLAALGVAWLTPWSSFAPLRNIGRRAALRRLAAGVLAPSLAVWAAPARAGMRTFPMGTRRGQIAFTNPPQVELDGRAEQIGPGTRIHDAQSNRLVFANTLKGQSFTVNYVRDGTGTIREIWILTPDEIQEKLPPTQQELLRDQQWRNSVQQATPTQTLN